VLNRLASPHLLPFLRTLRAGTISLLLVAASSGTIVHAGGNLVPWTGGATPPLALKDLAGSTVDLAALKGKVVLVNFWATWCAPCIHEMPSMQALRDKLGPAGFEVLAVNYQEGTPRITDFLKKRPLTLTIVRDADGQARTAWGVKVFPTSFIVGSDGRIRYSVLGDVEWTSPKVEAQIRDLLPKA
jgi:thiol-disulfide isomerase/thioredoxin